MNEGKEHFIMVDGIVKSRDGKTNYLSCHLYSKISAETAVFSAQAVKPNCSPEWRASFPLSGILLGR